MTLKNLNQLKIIIKLLYVSILKKDFVKQVIYVDMLMEKKNYEQEKFLNEKIMFQEIVIIKCISQDDIDLIICPLIILILIILSKE